MNSMQWGVGCCALVISALAGNRLEFPERADSRATGWRTSAGGGDAKFEIVSGGPSSARTAVVRVETGAAHAVWRIHVGLRPQAKYRLAARIATEVVEHGEAGIRLRQRSDRSKPITGTSDWQEEKIEFESGSEDSVEIEVGLFGRPAVRGVARVEAVRLEPVALPPLQVGAVTVDLASVGTPMDERIYSQFIEHLGRCIYGGIWAEMLEDRKFFYSITPSYSPYGPGVEPTPAAPFPILRASPWQIVAEGDLAAAVCMTTNRPFATRHAPQLAAGAAIRQRHLVIEEGRRYVGHVWARADGARARLCTMLDGTRAIRAEATLRGGDYVRIPLEFSATATVENASFTIRSDEGTLVVGAVSLMPADHVAGMRRDTLELLRRLRAPMYRWPGGNFVSGYDWRDGIGERDRRPPMPNPAWAGLEPNDFGLHEFIRFCREVGAEPMITVNTGFGDAHSAAALLEYVNGDERRTFWGRRRAENGARTPFGVRFWCIGNEMWGSWQLGYMKPEHYMMKHNWVVDTMRRVQPDFVAIASGQVGPWNELMLRRCVDRIDWIAEHFYKRDLPGELSHIRQIPEAIRQKAEAHRRYRREIPELTGRDIPVAVTEWNYWYGPYVFGDLGTRYFLRDALGIAAGFHEYARQSDLIISAFYAQTVNVIGAIKTDRTRAAMETTGLVLAMYREHFLGAPLATSCSPLLEAQALKSPDGRRVRLSVINPWAEAVNVPLKWRNGTLNAVGQAWRLAGADPRAYNDPQRPDVVKIEEVREVSSQSIELPPHSATIVELSLR